MAADPRCRCNHRGQQHRRTRSRPITQTRGARAAPALPRGRRPRGGRRRPGPGRAPRRHADPGAHRLRVLDLRSGLRHPALPGAVGGRPAAAGGPGRPAPPAPGRSSAAPPIALAVLVAGGLLAAARHAALRQQPAARPAAAGRRRTRRHVAAGRRQPAGALAADLRLRVGARPETEPSRWTAAARVAGGAVLVAAGVGSFLLFSGTLSAARDGLVAAVAVLAGLALLTAPLWWRLVADLTEERRERIRSQERADLAAHLHDSCCRRWRSSSGTPTSRARWPGWPAARSGSCGPGSTARRTGRRPGSPPRWRRSPARSRTRTRCRSRAWWSATPRWTTGSARWSRRPGRRWSTRPSTPGWTRSRCTRRSSRRRSRCSSGTAAAGFDPDAVAADRHGVQGSIMGRMERHGGKAAIRSRPGAGTEVELTMARNGT